MRTIWNGSLNFGLVNIPIGLAVAQQRKDVAFRTSTGKWHPDQAEAVLPLPRA